MNRTIAIVLTLVTMLCCGLPGLALLCTAALAGVGAQMPDVAQTYSPREIGLGIGIYVCGGLFLLLIPVIVGVISFRASKSNTPTTDIIDVPPTS
jgi:hypothetical protein